MKCRDLRAANRGQLKLGFASTIASSLWPYLLFCFLWLGHLILGLWFQSLAQLRREKFLEGVARHTIRCGGTSRLSEVDPTYKNLVFWLQVDLLLSPSECMGHVISASCQLFHWMAGLGSNPCALFYAEGEVCAKYGWEDVYSGKPIGAAWHKARV